MGFAKRKEKQLFLSYVFCYFVWEECLALFSSKETMAFSSFHSFSLSVIIRVFEKIIINNRRFVGLYLPMSATFLPISSKLKILVSKIYHE